MRIIVLYIIVSISILSCKKLVNNCEFSLYNDKNNLAFNDGNIYFPSSIETSECADKKLLKHFIIDGVRYCENEKYRYIEFTGGSNEIIDTCGWRCAIINFGQEYTFNRTALWFLKDSLHLSSYCIQCWNKETTTWDSIKEHKGELISSSFKFGECPIVFIQDTFQPVRSSKVRFLVNNCYSTFRMTEFEVYYDKYGARPDCLIK